jgi:hypothetical protein
MLQYDLTGETENMKTILVNKRQKPPEVEDLMN